MSVENLRHVWYYTITFWWSSYRHCFKFGHPQPCQKIRKSPAQLSMPDPRRSGGRHWMYRSAAGEESARGGGGSVTGEGLFVKVAWSAPQGQRAEMASSRWPPIVLREEEAELKHAVRKASLLHGTMNLPGILKYGAISTGWIQWTSVQFSSCSRSQTRGLPSSSFRNGVPDCPGHLNIHENSCLSVDHIVKGTWVSKFR